MKNNIAIKIITLILFLSLLVVFIFFKSGYFEVNSQETEISFFDFSKVIIPKDTVRIWKSDSFAVVKKDNYFPSSKSIHLIQVDDILGVLPKDSIPKDYIVPRKGPVENSTFKKWKELQLNIDTTSNE